jgi:hypothetical protein
MAYIYFLLGTGIVAILVAACAGIYEHNRSRHLETD